MSEERRHAKIMKVILSWANVTLLVCALAAAIVIGGYMTYTRMYADRYYPGVTMLGVRLDGLTQDEARKSVLKSIDAGLQTGFRFTYNGREIDIDATPPSTDPDVSADLVHYAVDDGLRSGYAYGRSGSLAINVLQMIRLRVSSIDLPVAVTLDDSRIHDAVLANVGDHLVSPKESTIAYDAATGKLAASQEASGHTIRFDGLHAVLLKQAQVLSFQPIELKTEDVKPTITKEMIDPLIAQANDLFARPLPSFVYEDQAYRPTREMLATWIIATTTNQGLGVAFDTQAFLHDVRILLPHIEKDPKDGSLVIKDGKIDAFTPGVTGVAIDEDALTNDLLHEWSQTTSTFDVPVKEVESKLTGEDPERLGVSELLGVGHSNFSGSPSNRRKNIAHGVAMVNGSIVQPDEIFSLIKTLGAIDGDHGWLPELVIKGNQTKPEFGGGLCQVGTTTFRAALASGLPIIERQNHSYRVRYYEPAGTDATIYDPKPDFRFQNDTGHPILINAYIKGDDAYFEFWGTKDGRVAGPIKSVVKNIVPPPPMKLIETLDLKPGVKKCTETAHPGADASFDYVVTMPSGEVKKTTFNSHYRPWQAVCLVGVTSLSTSSTTATVPLTP